MGGLNEVGGCFGGDEIEKGECGGVNVVGDLHRLPVRVIEPRLVGEGGVGGIVELGEVSLRGEGGHIR